VTDLYPDRVVVHPVPCDLDTLDRYLASCASRGIEPLDWPGSPCLVEGRGRNRMCLTCGGVDPEDYDPAFHGPDQSLVARRGRVRVADKTGTLIVPSPSPAEEG
jgi:hypothetical protein